MELLSPAGNIEKLTYAYQYGADAAYIGIKDLSLRAKADNFSGLEYETISNRKGRKKLYGALNIFFHNRDIERLIETIGYIQQYPFDAFIISDIGIVPLLRKHFPSVSLHLSTQANCTNSEAAKMYYDMGFTRIIAARELSLKELARIKEAVPGLEIEVFVHGAMCLAYSGRCFLSAYMANRSANKGNCAHPCRWSYRVLEESERPGEFFPIEEGNQYTTILSSKDINMIAHLREIRNAGIDAIKIEGRMKSLYYTALVTRSYRKALDALESGSSVDITPYIEELSKVSHREFTTGFYFDTEDVQIPTDTSYIREHQFLGTIKSVVEPGYFELSIKNTIRSDDTIDYIGPDIVSIADTTFTLYDENMHRIDKAHHGSKSFIRTDKNIKPGYILRKKLPPADVPK